MNKAFVRQVVPVILAIGLLWYVLKDVPLAELALQFSRADYRWLAVVGLVAGLYHLTRAARWQLTLQALGYHPSLFRTAVALLAGSLASMLIPGAGELTRCGTLQRTDGIPLAQSLGSVVAERVVDLVMLVVLIGLTLVFEFKRVGQYIIALLTPLLTRIAPNGQSTLVLVGLLIFGLLLLGLSYVLFRNQAVRQHPFMIRILRIGRDTGRGFMAIRQLEHPGLFIGLTVAGYVLAFLTTYLLFFATASTVALPLTAALTILTVSSLGGLAVPTQGGIGTYHFLVSRVLVLYGFTPAEGAVVATFLHAVGVGINLILSSASFLIVPFLLRQRSKQVEKPVA
ncbi:lysylphosphatidylglycerol synthase transmembrane domain-containing protein [Spirosoma areae]